MVVLLYAVRCEVRREVRCEVRCEVMGGQSMRIRGAELTRQILDIRIYQEEVILLCGDQGQTVKHAAPTLNVYL